VVSARAARGGGVLLLRHGIGFAVNAVGGVVLARQLGPSVMGLYFAAYMVFTVGRQLVDFCVTPHLIRHPESQPHYARYLWLQRALAGSLLVVVLGGVAAGGLRHVAPEHATDLAWLVSAAALGAAAFAWQSVPVADLERRLAYRQIGWIEVLEPITFNGVAILLVLGGGSVRALSVALVLRGLVPAVAAQRLAFLPRGTRSSAAGVTRLAGELSPLVGAQATLWAILVAPAVLVGKLAGPEQLGYSQLAYSLLGSIGIPAAVFQRVTFAALSRLQDDPLRFERAVSRSLALLAGFFLPLLSLLGSFALLWVPRVCGPQWTPMARVLLVATLPVALASFLGLVYAAVLAHGLNRLVLWQNVVHGLIYWTVLASLARSLGALAVPIAHLAALPAGLLYYRAFRTRHGGLQLVAVWAALAGAVGLSSICWSLVARGHTLAAVLAWVAVMSVVVPWGWRRLGVVPLLRRALRGGELEVPGL
jgi:PST family polysaccharide transporter